MTAELDRNRGSGPEGLCRVYRLPDATLVEDWDRIFVGPDLQQRMVSYLRVLARLAKAGSSTVGFGLRRALLLYGPPGCGKTSLAYGLPNEWATERDVEALLIVANTHAIRSGELGKTEKQVTALFDRIHEIATSGMLTFVVIDEVESIATDRASINPETNPLDTLFSVNAVLESLDASVRGYPNLIFILTTNIPRMIDRAISERVDFALEITLPGAEQRELILVDTLAEVDRLLERQPASWITSPEWPELLRVTDGLSGRQLRHLAVAALTLVDDEQMLAVEHLVTAARQGAEQHRRNIDTGGVYTHEYQRPASRGLLGWEDGATMRSLADNEKPTGPIARMDDARPSANSVDSSELIEKQRTEQDLDTVPVPVDDEDGVTKAGEIAADTVTELDPNEDGAGNVTEELITAEEARSATLAPLRSARQVMAAPKRSADGAWTATVDLFTSTLEARGFLGATEVAEDLERLRPLGRNLLTVHALEHGRTEFATGDMRLDVTYDYSVTGEEDVSLPPVEALGPLPDGLVPTLTFYVDRSPKDPFLGALVDEVTDTGRLAVRVIGPE